jgi:hypothetical protein
MNVPWSPVWENQISCASLLCNRFGNGKGEICQNPMLTTKNEILGAVLNLSMFFVIQSLI